MADRLAEMLQAQETHLVAVHMMSGALGAIRQ
jgi:hypothetical protein